jgi:predicted ArsR family transcriptional regulator
MDPTMAPKPAGISTRERILTYLKEHHTASVQVLSRAWRLTPADIRYHLAALVDEGLVDLVQRDPNQPARRGRPAQHYRLSTAAVPDNFPIMRGVTTACSAVHCCRRSHPEQSARGSRNQLAGRSAAPLPPTARQCSA